MAGVESLCKAHAQVDHREYGEALETLAAVAPSSCGEFEYLLHYTVGVAATGRGWARVDKVKTSTTIEAYRSRFISDRDWQFAKESFRKSIELNPKFSPAYLNLAECLSTEGRFEEGLIAADSLVKLVPRCATAYRLRGRLHQNLKRYFKAYDDLKIAAEFGPNDPETHLRLASVCVDLHENAEAIEAYTAAIRLGHSDAPMCYFNMGSCYSAMGKHGKALACYQKAKSLGFFPHFCDEEIAKCRARLE